MRVRTVPVMDTRCGRLVQVIADARDHTGAVLHRETRHNLRTCPHRELSAASEDASHCASPCASIGSPHDCCVIIILRADLLFNCSCSLKYPVNLLHGKWTVSVLSTRPSSLCSHLNLDCESSSVRERAVALLSIVQKATTSASVTKPVEGSLVACRDSQQLLQISWQGRGGHWGELQALAAGIGMSSSPPCPPAHTCDIIVCRCRCVLQGGGRTATTPMSTAAAARSTENLHTGCEEGVPRTSQFCYSVPLLHAVAALRGSMCCNRPDARIRVCC